MNKNIVLAAIVLLALALRLVGLSFGLPNLYHQDEPIMVNRALAIGASQDWNPHFFTNGSFPIYSLFFLYGFLFVILKGLGVVADPNAFGIFFLKDPSLFYLLGRLFLGVLMGVATVYWLGRKSGLVAAAFLAVSLIHVQHSHYIYSDIPLTLATTLLFFNLLDIVEKPRTSYFLGVGVFWGWALSCKMTAAYLAPTIALAFLISAWRENLKPFSLWVKRVLPFVGGACVSFFIFSPFAFLDWKNFSAQLWVQKQSEGRPEFLFHFTHSILQGAGPVIVALAILGSVYFFKKNKRAAWVTIFFLVTFYLANSLSGMSFARRILPMIPILCFLAGWGWDRIASKKAYLVGGLLLLTAIPTIYSLLLFCREDTRTACRQWFESQVPAGSVLVVDNRFFGPHLLQTRDLIDEKSRLLGESDDSQESSYISNPEIDPVRAKRLELARQAVDASRAYRVYALSENPESKNLPLFMLPVVKPESEAVLSTGAQYFVFQYGEYREEFHRLKQSLGDRLERVVVFSPYKNRDQRFSLDLYESTGAPLAWLEIFSRQSLGPYLEVYHVRA